MSEVRVVVTENGKMYSGITHYGVAHRMFAALSGNPKSFEDLSSRMYLKFGGRPAKSLIRWDAVPNVWAHDAGVIRFNFDKKAVFSTQRGFDTKRSGWTYYHPEQLMTGLSDRKVRYAIPKDWKISDRSGYR